MYGNESDESWVEDLADMEADSGEADFDGDAEYEEGDGEDAEARQRRRRSGGRRRARARGPVSRSKSRGYLPGGRAVRGVEVNTPAGVASMALPRPVPSLQQFQQTARDIADDMKENSHGIQQLESRQRQEVDRLDSTISDLKKEMARHQKRAAWIAVLTTIATPAFRLLATQLPETLTTPKSSGR